MKTNTRTPIESEAEVEAERERGSDGAAVVVEFAIPIAEFALGETVAALEDVAFEVERVVAHEDGRFAPLVWARGSEREALEDALREDRSVATFECFAAIEEETSNDYLYRMDWAERVDVVGGLLVDRGGTVLTMRTAKDHWQFRVLLPDRDTLARTYESCEEAGVTIDLKRIYALEDGRQGRFGLTDEQREALALAFEAGYYGVPRGAMAKGLAKELDISHQALSERIRRGHGNLVENAIALDRNDKPGGNR
ncbi:DNA-binding protein [Halobacteriales archaeon QS_3_64_16]|nr:MAG: DNA-binding protein [Halobacteriales archaeon QS_3_64_16]